MSVTADLLEKIWVVDESALSEKLIRALAEGKAVIHDGVAYWAEGSGQTGIIQHLPFKETLVKSAEEAIKAAQMTTVIATAASTCIVLGALIVQTKYLAAKLDKIQSTVDEISRDLHAQNIIYYMDKITDYIGCVEVARTLLSDRSLVDEIKDIAYPLLASVAAKRNHALSFIDNILNLARNTNELTDKHYELVVNFAHMMMEIMPLGMHIEYLLASRVGKPRLAEQILLDGAKRYDGAMNLYKDFLNEQHRALVRGSIGGRAEIYHRIEHKAEQLIGSQENRLLLSLPTGRIALETV
ncbi:hypothetical protein MHM84_20245 [Halomonas sp. McH1-25]|uniref:hypothetical protein n=1 Tax=unclassified Halomonas TaxID=2609666 RepID=UPI001EF43DBD|nr:MULTISPECIES: hypothetical protein [unclassified Halomonas]MCG7602076.1 hypothetical protein [Halomonas sp. McH1-25]MCP1342912.1 hypothetical protein [Halomonas sp. FL8]MCP1362531.1 hypothetical protein [Halomonas sp. BBD45]MCP1363961.1 hypothetical protein [Halomonas sp. BBD48]